MNIFDSIPIIDSQHDVVTCNNFILGRPPQSQRDRARKGKKNKRKGNSRRGRGKKCRKQRYRDYYIEPNGCRSKKSFKMVIKYFYRTAINISL